MCVCVCVCVRVYMYVCMGANERIQGSAAGSEERRQRR